ncbi:hypothetical protein BJ138DRAFT_1113782 [Hygrophoropsis aurantiaca]|uniref:Uncharacterized protein n=1 Tax=Hygrophoropsis aurantiaca TaxID=72124 RepID=A0ACB8ACF0_9AGAM|nr:hypothetical protein BJ138DRAFT_1113782 [Hygrophoropsis aurantiaca]
MSLFANSCSGPSDYKVIVESDALSLLKIQTGMNDEETLTKQIYNLQSDAYEIGQHTCLRTFTFTRLKISEFPAYYDQVLGIGDEGKLLLHIGRCPANHLSVRVSAAFNSRTGAGHLHHLLYFGQISAIHASSFFHELDERKQLYMAKALAGLLSPQAGSMIFGAHAAETVSGKDVDMFLHWPEWWVSMWDGVVFGKGTVIVDVGFKDSAKGENSTITVWSVTRL